MGRLTNERPIHPSRARVAAVTALTLGMAAASGQAAGGDNAALLTELRKLTERMER